MVRADAQPDARELLRAQGVDDGLRAVVRAGAAALTDADRAPGQVPLVPNQEQAGRPQFVLFQQLPHRDAAEIHERLGLGQEHFLPGEPAAADERFGLRPLHANRTAIRQLIHGEKSEVVRRPLVFRAGIPKPHDKPHTSAVPTYSANYPLPKPACRFFSAKKKLSFKKLERH